MSFHLEKKYTTFLVETPSNLGDDINLAIKIVIEKS